MIYVNFDLETTGPSPDKNAIIQIGAVAHDTSVDEECPLNWKEIGSFSANIAIPPNRVWDPDTRTWWETDPEAGQEKLQKILENTWSTGWTIESLFHWLLHLPHYSKSGLGTRVGFVANPIAYDLPFLRSYMKEYVGLPWETWAQENKSGLGGIDLPTLAMCVMGAEARAPIVPYPDARRRMWPERWNPKDLPHTHIAIDDARHQAYAFLRMMHELEEIRARRPY